MSDALGNQLTPEGLKNLLGVSGFRLIETETPGPDTQVNVGPIPRRSLQAVFDLLSHWEPEMDQLLATMLVKWTTMNNKEIRETIISLDTLYSLLYDAGMRPTKIKAGKARQSMGTVVRVQK